MAQTKIRGPQRMYRNEFKNQLVQLYVNSKRENDISLSLIDQWSKCATSVGSFKEKDSLQNKNKS